MDGADRAALRAGSRWPKTGPSDTTAPLAKLYGWTPKIQKTLVDLKDGRPSFSTGLPILVSRLDSQRGAIYVIDGYHRTIEALRSGKKTLRAVVDVHVPRIERTGGAHRVYTENRSLFSAWVPKMPKRKTSWYHGGPRVEDWNHLRWDRERSTSDLNAQGPGMYWTTDEEESVGYMHGHSDAVLYKATMRDDFKLLPKKKPTMKALYALYELADQEKQEVFLSNWSIAAPASNDDVRRALTPYSRQSSIFDAYVTLYHDLFLYDADAYVLSMLLLNYDGHVFERGDTGGSKKRKHLVLWNPRKMWIEEAY